MNLNILSAESKEQLEHIRKLFLEYASSLVFDLSFQDFERELADLPGQYSPPNGRLLLAVVSEKLAGCVALRKITEHDCEMKRLYVRPEYRGQDIGKQLVFAIIEEARKIGYSRMLLDTVPSMKSAIKLYRSLGFKSIEPYRYNPIEGAMYLALDL
ncbi:acetyltransferase CD1211 [Collibacillus ludicampi]|uniref:Acetyltransferase CD1211 n=1 Tax=Collibacillus ludicampi TaxID=2771369 RepID=A0AAV4LH36_9BACL|nr:acetyltransferase CD1211 [Collibacillus ludicampi]